jgi:suppressor of tumorigenicity protein 13
VEEPEEEDTGLLSADNEAPQAMGSGKEPSDADLEKASSEKAAAMEAHGNGNFEEAIAHFTAAINANSTQAMLFALRANAYLSAKKPNAAIRDADHAIKLNPDSAKGFKVRGKANRALGKYEDALKDLGTGQRIDFDEGSVELIKFLEQKVAKRRERNRKKEEADKAERRRKEAEAKAKKPEAGIYDDMPEMEDLPGEGNAGAAGAAGAFPGMGGMPGMGAMPPGMDKIFSDPEVQAMLADPEVMQKLSGMMSGKMPNPAELAADPKLRKLFEKFGKGGM